MPFTRNSPAITRKNSKPYITLLKEQNTIKSNNRIGFKKLYNRRRLFYINRQSPGRPILLRKKRIFTFILFTCDKSDLSIIESSCSAAFA